MKTELYGENSILWNFIDEETLKNWLIALREDQFDEMKLEGFNQRYSKIHYYYGEKLLDILSCGKYWDQKNDFREVKEAGHYPEEKLVNINFDDLKRTHPDLYDFYSKALKDYIHRCRKIDDKKKSKIGDKSKCNESIRTVNEYIKDNFYKKK